MAKFTPGKIAVYGEDKDSTTLSSASTAVFLDQANIAAVQAGGFIAVDNDKGNGSLRAGELIAASGVTASTPLAFPSAGSIAFVGFNADGNDGFAIVAISTIPVGTTIYFNDNEFVSTAFNTGETSFAWTTTSEVAAGTIVTFDNISISTKSVSTGSLGTGGMALGSSGETIYAYVGTSANAPTTFLAAITNSDFSTTTTGTLVGTGLVVGQTAISLLSLSVGGPDVAAFTGGRGDQASFADYLAIINTASNWIAQDGSGNQEADGTAPDVPFSTTAFTTVSAENQVVSIAVSPTTSAEGNGGSVVYTFTVTRTGGTTGALDFVANFGAGDTDAADTGGVAPGTVNGTIAAGQASTIFTVTVSGDTTIEGDETFSYTIVSVTNASATPTIGTALATATITNDDGGFAGSSVAGSSAANTVNGTPLNDIFLLQTGGDDTATGADGNDAFYFGAAFTGADSVDGGNGTRDQVGLQGDYSVGVTLSATSAVGVEQFVLLPGNDVRFGAPGTGTSLYNIVTGDAAIGAGQRVTFQGNRLRVGENFTLDASGETNGSVFTYGGLGVEQLTGSQGADAFYFGTGRFGATDVIDGQGGIDQVALQGTYSGANAVTFGATQLVNVEMLLLFGNNDSRFGGAGSGTAYEYDIVMNDGNVAAGGRMTIQANNLATDEALTFDGSAELDGAFSIFSGNGTDVIVGSAGADTISGRGGADTMTGGLGNDTFLYTNVADSSMTAQDTIVDFTIGDIIDLSRIDANALTGGNGSFSFIGADAFSSVAGQLRATNTSGSDWLVEADIDGNGVADISILVTSGDADPITATDFIL